jgi:uncharacterized protein YPO0396
MTTVDRLRPGFRLQRLEVRNWGTFDDKIHILDPGGATALLVGENGTGKSTLVDALLTLLVPRVKRNYNVSAGAAKKRERDEKTYVLGAYASESNSSEAVAQLKFLRRAGDSPTILLACFANERTGAAVTLAQLLWVQDDEVRKLFLISKAARTIAEDFAGLEDAKTLRKSLRARGFEVEDVFNDYAEKVIRYLQMESMTTLALFNQTVAIKEISHVSAFIRDHMLERLDTRELVSRLEQHYEDLTRCWAAIQRARTQLDLLQPVVDKSKAIDALDAQLAHSEMFREAVPALFADVVQRLLKAEIQLLESRMSELDELLSGVQLAISDCSRQEWELSQALESDTVGRQLRYVEEQLEETTKNEKSRRELSHSYHECLGKLGVTEEVSTKSRFDSHRTWAIAEQASSTEQISIQATRIAEAGELLKTKKVEAEELVRELQSLKSRTDLIPERDRGLREVIAKGANVPISDLPFVGELMDVRDEWNQNWRGALERLLRGFGLSILVPERLYSRVNRFINDHNLRGRVVYHRVVTESLQSFRGSNEGRVVSKLEFKRDHPLAKWVEHQVATDFNHRCCETVEEFEAVARFAITKQGLIRGGGTKHTKDDRQDINDARFHILGWRNRDKVVRLENDLSQAVKAAQTHAAEVVEAQESRKHAESRLKLAADMLSFRSYEEVDWRSQEQQRLELQAQKDELERSSDQIKELRTQLESVQKRKRQLENERDELTADKGRLQERQIQHCDRLSAYVETLDTVEAGLIEKLADPFCVVLKAREIHLHNATILQQKVEHEVADEILSLQKKREDEAKVVVRFMERFLGQYPEMRSDLSAEESCISEFVRLRYAIEADDLPRHEERFKNLMSQDVLTHVASFEGALASHRDEIEDKIRHLNDALKNIDYSPRTFIQIKAVPTTDVDVRSFRAMLKSCFDFGLNPGPSSREAAFERITDLIRAFRERVDWTSKVTDTRNWLTFGVEELRRDDEQQENYYTDTGGRSGGQKAKLAFTILASAIAYQYRIARDTNNPNSFRFVVVDEMFARSDEENSRYALQLFSAFNLQLLIVSPLDARARVVEPFVSSYHLTVNPTAQASTVFTVTAEEVGARVRQQAASATAGDYANS